jgi:hypothetical protein
LDICVRIFRDSLGATLSWFDKKNCIFFFVFHAEFVGVMMTIEIVHSNIG